MMYTKDKIEFQEQQRLIAESIESGVDFSKILALQGLNYDSLRYETNPDISTEFMRPIESLDVMIKSTEAIPAVSFFLVQEDSILGLVMQALII